MRVVLDTNVLIAGLRTKKGASYRILTELEQGLFEIVVSVPLILEYEATLIRQLEELSMTTADVEGFLDYLCRIGEKQSVFYLWRPHLTDPGDDMVLELAVASRAEAIVTFNQKDFLGIHRFGIQILTPGDLLNRIGDST